MYQREANLAAGAAVGARLQAVIEVEMMMRYSYNKGERLDWNLELQMKQCQQDSGNEEGWNL